MIESKKVCWYCYFWCINQVLNGIVFDKHVCPCPQGHDVRWYENWSSQCAIYADKATMVIWRWSIRLWGSHPLRLSGLLLPYVMMVSHFTPGDLLQRQRPASMGYDQTHCSWCINTHKPKLPVINWSYSKEYVHVPKIWPDVGWEIVAITHVNGYKSAHGALRLWTWVVKGMGGESQLATM